ncbi:hypothetical protein HELRODRAFT_188008 [Helobdella robusta]|uniref:Uncharacterized protein n=1 Tax=Helobdella robusta TaxID=6412 RepID=T1FPJ5_HELRO|nr:hypothetical protein HELRODRAFT_188008 [Helobdella robusta]ESO12846.1 hypothetical protein HELRODRAFT_188008 [Helobdella robusta]
MPMLTSHTLISQKLQTSCGRHIMMPDTMILLQLFIIGKLLEKMSHKWKNGIFGCFNDCSICILSFLIPCYIAGKNAKGVGRSCLIFGCLSILEPIGCLARSVIRQDIRTKHNIEIIRLTEYVVFKQLTHV